MLRMALQPLTGQRQTSFRHKGHLIVVRRCGHCQWLQGDQWLDAYMTMRNTACDPNFRYELRKACLRLGEKF